VNTNAPVYQRHAAHCRELAERARAIGDEGLALWWEREAERWEGYAESAQRYSSRAAAGRHAAATASSGRRGRLNRPASPAPGAVIVTCDACGREVPASSAWALPGRTVCDGCHGREHDEQH